MISLFAGDGQTVHCHADLTSSTEQCHNAPIWELWESGPFKSWQQHSLDQETFPGKKINYHEMGVIPPISRWTLRCPVSVLAVHQVAKALGTKYGFVKNYLAPASTPAALLTSLCVWAEHHSSRSHLAEALSRLGKQETRKEVMPEAFSVRSSNSLQWLTSSMKAQPLALITS